MKHVDALSRNPIANTDSPLEDDTVFRIEEADWVLSGQLTDAKVVYVHDVLSKPPETDEDRKVYQNYALRDGRVYRITARGLQWVVPRGMRNQVVRAAHDEKGHFAVMKTLYRLCENYWFPRMREYVERYIASCIPCLYNKRPAGKQEGFLHPIEKVSVPLHTIHIDHLGPFPKSVKGNVYLLVLIDGFTKFSILRAVRTTKTNVTVRQLNDIFSLYGFPHTIISDRGTSFTSRRFENFCLDNSVKHVLNAVATPRANGQVERLNRTILSSLLTTSVTEDRWDDDVPKVQLAINTTVSKATGKTPFELMYGYTARTSSLDTVLLEEVSSIPTILEDLAEAREEASRKIQTEQARQKHYYDRRRKKSRTYKVGDLVLIEKQKVSTGTSRKLVAPYAGPMVVKEVLPNDRYVVADMQHCNRRAVGRYRNVVASDRMKPWVQPGGVSDSTDQESGDDGVILSDPDSNDNEEDLETRSLQDGRM